MIHTPPAEHLLYSFLYQGSGTAAVHCRGQFGHLDTVLKSGDYFETAQNLSGAQCTSNKMLVYIKSVQQEPVSINNPEEVVQVMAWGDK